MLYSPNAAYSASKSQSQVAHDSKVLILVCNQLWIKKYELIVSAARASLGLAKYRPAVAWSTLYLEEKASTPPMHPVHNSLATTAIAAADEPTFPAPYGLAKRRQHSAVLGVERGNGNRILVFEGFLELLGRRHQLFIRICGFRCERETR